MAKLQSAQHALKYTWHGAANDGVRQPGNCCIMVIGVGGAGNNTVTRLIEMGITGAECIAINTDALHLSASRAHQKILIGEKLTKGLGVGGDPKLGRAAIEESRKHVEDLLSNINIAFITCGLGGGTGTGSAPVIAEIARRNEAIVVGVVTTPFRIEKGRMKYAANALTEMRRQCDTVVVIDNNKLMQLVPQLPINDAFRVADQVLANMIKGIVETISAPSLINLDFADFKTIVGRGGVAVVGVGESDAPNRAEEAVRNALRSPLLDVDYIGATGALIHVTGDNQMSIEEANRVGEIVTEMMDVNALVIWGARVNPEQNGKLKVTLVMTGVNSPHILSGFGTIAPQLFNLEPYAEPEKPLDVKLDLYQMENFQ
ncbi:MAG: cell division protein FtsZ [Candidatus Bathyarchaeota archaeon]|nr:cell division protein FtsZ [Candidatus Bathyarchaeota archaeon]MDH5787838.1 cell division protein FtsZ [Candidatus Bathyarchaeota archaeon]